MATATGQPASRCAAARYSEGGRRAAQFARALRHAPVNILLVSIGVLVAHPDDRPA